MATYVQTGRQQR